MIDDTTNPDYAPVTINDAGMVAFVPSSRNAIYRGNGQALEMVVDTSGPFSYFQDQPVINNLGDVGFVANLDSGPMGHFHWSRSRGRQNRPNRRSCEWLASHTISISRLGVRRQRLGHLHRRYAAQWRIYASGVCRPSGTRAFDTLPLGCRPRLVCDLRWAHWFYAAIASVAFVGLIWRCSFSRPMCYLDPLSRGTFAENGLPAATHLWVRHL